MDILVWDLQVSPLLVYMSMRERKRERPGHGRNQLSTQGFWHQSSQLQPLITFFFVMGKCTIFNNGEYHRYSDLNNVVLYVYHIMKS